jgi:hypothetical protein
MCSKEATTSPSPEPNKSSPHHSCPVSLRSILTVSSCLGHPNGILRFSYQNAVYISVLSHLYYTSWPFHPLWFVKPDGMWQRVQIMNLLYILWVEEVSVLYMGVRSSRRNTWLIRDKTGPPIRAASVSLTISQCTHFYNHWSGNEVKELQPLHW